MAQHGLRRVPRVLAQLNGKVGALQRRGQHRSNLCSMGASTTSTATS